MATPAAVSAVVRAYRPTFQSAHDKVAFAIHGVLSVSSFTLLAVGPAADAADDQVRSSTEEASLEGWNSTGPEDQGGYYSFLYSLPKASTSSSEAKAGTPLALLVKAIIVGAQLLVSFCVDPCPAGQTPDNLELDVQAYAGDGYSGATAYAYTQLEQLVQLVQGVLHKQVPQVRQQPTHTAATATTARQGGNSSTQPAQTTPGDVDPLRDYSQPARGPRHPLTVGGGDLEPGMLPMPGGRHGFDPLEGALPGVGGGLGPAGGMHVGPGHPGFGPGRMGPQLGPGMGGPGPGMRWDPIAPPGLPGFNPGDFRPGGPGRGGPGNIDPDIMQPGRGRGTDWDEMYG